jgi:hypothetical protein
MGHSLLVTSSSHPAGGASLTSRGQLNHRVAGTSVVDQAANRKHFLIQSCHSTWIFDENNRRFRRRLNRSEQFGLPVVTDWRPYDRLLIDDLSSSFVVFLDHAGSRVLRSRRHGAPCDCCGTDTTQELSLEELTSALAS